MDTPVPAVATEALKQPTEPPARAAPTGSAINSSDARGGAGESSVSVRARAQGLTKEQHETTSACDGGAHRRHYGAVWRVLITDTGTRGAPS